MHPMSPLWDAVLHRGPGHRLGQAASGERLEVVEYRPDLAGGGVVVAVPGNHAGAVAPHLVPGVGQVSHQLRVPAQHLNVAALQPGRVAFPQQVGHCGGG